MIQVLLVLFGVSAVYLTQSSNPKLSRFAPIVGMLGQPFWFIAAYPQPGMLIVVTLYTYCWGLGIYNQWLKQS